MYVKVDYKVHQGLQSMSMWITKCVRDYKVCQGGLQSASGITKCDGITKYGGTNVTFYLISKKIELIPNRINIRMTYYYFAQIPYTKRFQIYISTLISLIFSDFSFKVDEDEETPISVFTFCLMMALKLDKCKRGL